LHPSRNISHVSEILILFESSVFALDAVVGSLLFLLLLSFVDECCLNQTSERSSNLKINPYTLKENTHEFYLNKFTWIRNEIMNTDYIVQYIFD